MRLAKLAAPAAVLIVAPLLWIGPAETASAGCLLETPSGCAIAGDAKTRHTPRSQGGACWVGCDVQQRSDPLPEWHWPSNHKNPPTSKQWKIPKQPRSFDQGIDRSNPSGPAPGASKMCPDGYPRMFGVC